jgi:hypothetical protein
VEAAQLEAAYASFAGTLRAGSSAARLARSYESLSDVHRAREIPVVIWDNGSIAREGPMPIGDLIVGNATFHLDMHHEQLRALAP